MSFDTAPHSWKKEWGGFLFLVISILLFRMLIISPYRIPSGSMIPTLLVGDYLLVSRCSYGWSRYSIFFGNRVPYFSSRIAAWAQPKRGDIVVFTCPYKITEDFIKRLIGVPGDTVRLSKGVLWVNGKEASLKKISSSPYKAHDSEKHISGDVYEETIPGDDKFPSISHLILKQNAFGSSESDFMDEVTVPEKHYFFLGDNRDGSGDSRFLDQLGFVHEDYVIGRALLVHYSIDEDFHWYEPWNWPFHIRYHRIFTVLR